MLDEKDIAIIEKHLLSTLSAEEQSYFDTRISESDFSEELSYQKDIQIALQAAGRADKKIQLQKIEAELKIKERDSKSEWSMSRKTWIALLVGIIILAFLGYYFNSKKVPTEKLYAEYAVPFPNVVSLIKRDSFASNEPVNPYQLYEQRNYSNAIEAFSTLPTSEEKDFYLALSYLFILESDKSESLLNSIIKSADHRFYQPAQWYLALIQLRSGKQSESVKQLKLISQQATHPYAKKAEELLEALN